MNSNSMPIEGKPAQAKTISQGARELAYRRWRSGNAGQSGLSLYDAQSSASPARMLAHHRWGTPILPLKTAMPENSNKAVTPASTIRTENFTIFAVLAIVALIVFFWRKDHVRKNRPSAADGVESVHDVLGPVSVSSQKMTQAWQPWLIGGSIIAALLLLIFSSGARRHWGWVAGALALMLSVMVTPEAPPR